jgi:hypothetical protein
VGWMADARRSVKIRGRACGRHAWKRRTDS